MYIVFSFLFLPSNDFVFRPENCIALSIGLVWFGFIFLWATEIEKIANFPLVTIETFYVRITWNVNIYAERGME